MSGSTRFVPVACRLMLGLVAGFSLVALGLGGCSKRITPVDPGFVPEGKLSPEAQLVLWYEAPGETLIYLDRAPQGASIDEFCGFIIPGVDDSLIDRGPYWRQSPGTINGTIFDGTRAREYQVLRREGNGGFRQAQDFPATPLRRWPDAQYEEYTFVDRFPSSFSPSTYIGRGIVTGTVTKESPLTNVGIAPRPTGADTIVDITYTGFCNPCDSVFTLRWTSVPGAVRYWMQVYRFAVPATPFELLNESVPGPIANRKTHDIFVGFIDAPDTAYQIGYPLPNVRILLRRGTDYLGPYFVRVSAVDGNGRLVGYTRGNYARIPGEGRYTLFRMGAVVVAPTNEIARCRREPPFP